MAYELLVNEYRAAHGRDPRGSGNWFFEVHPEDGEPYMANRRGRLSDLFAELAQEARANGYARGRVVVLP